MSVRTLNGLGNTNIYVNNMFADGEAIEITQTSNTTQAQVNLNMKKNTSAETTPNSNDLLLLGDNSTGKIIKYIEFSNLISGIDVYTGTLPINIDTSTNVISLKGLSGMGSNGQVLTTNGTDTLSWSSFNQSNWTLSGNDLYPLATTTKVAIGGTSVSGVFKFEVYNGDSNFNGQIVCQDVNIINNGYLEFRELVSNGSNYIRLKCAASLDSNVDIVLPSSAGTIPLQYSGTSPISVNNTTHTISLNSAVPVDKGGTGETTYTNGQILIGDTTANTLAKATLTAGTGINITNGNGTITIDNSSTSNWTLNTGLLYPISASTKVAIGNNAITAGFNFENNGAFFNNGSITTGDLIVKDTSNTGIRLDVYDSGAYTTSTRFIKPILLDTEAFIQLDYPILTGATGTTPRLGIYDNDLSHLVYFHSPALTSDINITLPSATGTLLTDVDTIPVNKGGTGQTSYTNGQLLIGNTTSNTLAKATLTAGTGISITNGTGSITIASSLTSSNWTLNAGVLYPLSTSTKVVIGATSITTGFEFENTGDFNNTGNITTGDLVVKNTSNTGIRLDVYDSGAYTTNTRFIKPVLLGGEAFVQLDYPIITGSSSSAHRIAIYDSDLSNFVYIDTPALTGDITLTYPDTTGTLALETIIDTQTSKTYITAQLSTPTITGSASNAIRGYIKDYNGDHQYTLKVPNLAADKDLTLPSLGGTIATDISATDFRNKSFTQTTIDFFDTGIIGKKFTIATPATISTNYTLTIPNLGYNDTFTFSADLQNRLNITETPSSNASVSSMVNDQDPVIKYNFPTSASTKDKYILTAQYPSPNNDSLSFWKEYIYADTNTIYAGWIFNDDATTGVDLGNMRSDGNLVITGSVNPSDSRIKTNVVDANGDECIDILKSIKLKKYNYTETYINTYKKTTTKKVYGFLADDIYNNENLSYCCINEGKPKVLYNTDGTTETLNDFKTIDKSKILSLLWGVCSSQQNKIETLETELESIKVILENNNLI